MTPRAGRSCGRATAAFIAAAWAAPSCAASMAPTWISDALLATYYAVLGVLAVYTLRHAIFTLNRLFGRQRHPYVDVDTVDWPSVTVLVPAHNEALVIEHCLDALLDADYPSDRLVITPIDDRSTDQTREIINTYVAGGDPRLRPLFRDSGRPGKAAAIQAASALVDTDLILVFDADYIPGRALIKQLVAPFFDPEVGAVMGRVVPHNTGSNLLTRLLDLERAGGYQVDQQARMNLELLPQYGGSVGGTRTGLLRQLGGWREDALAEDTDLTYRLLLAGFKVVYQNRCECYEEVPERWQERNRQIMRWARGHNQATWRYLWGVLRSPYLRLFERIDAVLLLGVFLIAPVLMLGWLSALGLYFMGTMSPGPSLLGLLFLAAFSGLGNFAAFFEMAAAVHLDDGGKRVRLLPFALLSFVASFVNIVRATTTGLLGDALFARELHWEKTARYRRNGNGNGNGNGPKPTSVSRPPSERQRA